MTVKEQIILKTLVNSLKFNDFKPKLTISTLNKQVLGMESYQITISDDNKSNKTKPVKYFIAVSHYNEQAPEATDLCVFDILF